MLNLFIKKYTVSISIAGILFACFSGTVLAAATSSDPGRLAVGARALSMGNAFTALSDDPSAIFTNPAGILLFDNMQFTSMYATIFDELHYKQAGLAFPLGSGMGGVGFVGNSIDGIGLTKISTANNRPYLDKDTTFHDDIFYLTYAENITSYLKPLQWPGDVLLGSSLKFYSKGSPDVDSYNGSGISADLGMLYKWSPDITLGLQYRNFLPRFASFGSIKWAGSEDDLPSLLKLGSSINYYNWNLLANVDADIDPGLKKPMLFHLGGEWRPISAFIFRAGIDQLNNPLQNGNGVYSNYTFGLGAEISGVRFDYAYRAFYNEDANHLFTLTLLGEPGPYKWVNRPKTTYYGDGNRLGLLNAPVVKINSPEKNLVTSRSKIIITGSSSTAVTLNINGKDVFFKGGPSLNYVVDLNKLGRTTIDINMKYEGQDINILSKKVIHLQDAGGAIRDTDMPKFILNSEVSYNATATIPGKVLIKDILAMANIYTPTPKGKAPDFNTIMKIARSNNLIPETPKHPFDPEKPVSWGEALAIMAKIEGYKVDPRTSNPKAHWTTPFIRSAKDHQIIPGYWNKSPDAPINGREMLDILNNSNLGKNKVRDLVNWVWQDGDVAYDDGIKTQRFDRNQLMQRLEMSNQFSSSTEQIRNKRSLDYLNNYNSQADKPNNPSYADNPIDRASRLSKLYQDQFHKPLSKTGAVGDRLALPGSPVNTRSFYAEKQPKTPDYAADKNIQAPNVTNEASGKNSTRFSQEVAQTALNKKPINLPVLENVPPPTPASGNIPVSPSSDRENLTLNPVATTPNLPPKTLADYQVTQFPPQDSIIVEISIDDTDVVSHARSLDASSYAPRIYPLRINDTTLYELFLPPMPDKDKARERIKELRKLGYAAYQNEAP